MRTAPTAHPADTYPYRKAAGDEPLPGYRLLAPLGHGGFGEVWECEAPGGLHKAVKFVFDDRHDMACVTGDNSLQQEFDAVEHVKAIRHPFLLTMERVERTGAVLIIVMELADRNLQDRFNECRAEGLPGIPREELLAYFADAAEALDLISGGHGLQHLDVKPANLFLVGSHVKVGDYGLVRRQAAEKGGLARGLTPKYVSPEVVNGQVDSRSDQYSLALVYQELLTGTFPYSGGNAQALLIQHATAQPDVSALPQGDQPAIKKALSKDPSDRFPSCVALVEALMAPTGVLSAAETWRDGAGSSMMLRRARMTRAAGFGQASSDTLPIPGPRPVVEDTAWPPGIIATPGPIGWATQADADTAPGGAGAPTPAGPMPPLTGPPRLVTPSPSHARRAPPSEPIVLKVASPPPPPAPGMVAKLARIHAVEPVVLLRGGERPAGSPPKPADLVASLVRAAAAEHPTPANAGELVRLTGGAWTCRFPVRTGGGMIAVKLASLPEQWHADLTWPDQTTAVFRRNQNPGLLKMLAGKSAAGLEVSVHLPPDSVGVGEVAVIGRTTGTTDPGFAQTAARMLQRMVEDVKKLIQNQADRRGSVRVPAGFAMEVYPVSGAGEVMPPLAAKCRDVSAGGVCFEAAASVPTSYVYAAFAGVRAATGWAILTKLVRTRPDGTAYVAGGRFRTDL